MLLSEKYVKVLLETHAQNKGWGNGGKYAVAPVVEYALVLNARTILDYGCGQGVLKKRLDAEQRSLFIAREYDPGIVGKDERPDPADLVVCTDVLEHVEPDYVIETLAELRHLAIKGLYAVISCTPANLILSDGRNAHLTIKPAYWWLGKLHDAGFNVVRHDSPKGLHVWAQ